MLFKRGTSKLIKKDRQSRTKFLPMLNCNLFDFDIAGVYKIVCSKTNCIYYGQTSCFLRRCSQHLQNLKTNNHSCLRLQNDFNRFQRNDFVFEVVCIELSLTKRLQIEKYLIETTAKTNLYNSESSPIFYYQPRIAQQIQIAKVSYASIADAARKSNQSSRTIRSKLDDPANLTYQRIKIHRHSYFDEYQVIIEGKVYPTTSNVVKSGLAKTTRQVRDRCRTQKWHNWILVKKCRTTIPIGSRVKIANPKQEPSLRDEDIV